jgi:NADP-dependent 3-hydroxy acid dehydrogenase YdfG
MGAIWITGASTGIGRALALRLAGEGRPVAISARNADDLTEVARGQPDRLYPFPLDVTDRAAVRATVEAIVAKFGQLDLAVLNAGTHKPMSLDRFSSDTLRSLIDINVMGVAYAIEAVVPAMLARRSGHIAVVSSVAGWRGLPTSAAYGATKAAMHNLVESLKFDADKAGIKLQLINPGFVKTPLTDKNPFPMPFLVTAEQAADRIAEGLKGDSFEITFPRRFTFQLKFLRMLPYRWYFPAISKFTGM